MLSRDEISRYSRHILLPQVGKKGQEKLKESRITMIGAGGLGSPALLYLAAAGIGHIRIIDSDAVDITNLQRQVIFQTQDIGKSKAHVAAERLRALNPEITIESREVRFTPANARGLLSDSHLVIEASDNFETKFLVNDACVLEKIPLILGGILRFEGQVLVIVPGEGACYRCVFQNPPPPEAVPSCAEAGVLGAVAGVIGSLQASEALKMLSGADLPAAGRMLAFDAFAGTIRSLSIPRNPRCPVCGENPQIHDLLTSSSNSEFFACSPGTALETLRP